MLRATLDLVHLKSIHLNLLAMTNLRSISGYRIDLCLVGQTGEQSGCDETKTQVYQKGNAMVKVC